MSTHAPEPGSGEEKPPAITGTGTLALPSLGSLMTRRAAQEQQGRNPQED